MIWLVFSIGLPILSSYCLCKHFALSSQIQTKALTSSLIFFLLILLPVHFVATVELYGRLGSVTLPRIVSVQIIIFLIVLVFCRSSLFSKAEISEKLRFHWVLAECPRYIQACAVIIVLVMSIFAVNLTSGFPRGYDALMYQFLVATRWFQDQSLRLPSTLDWQYCLPGNGNIGMLLMMQGGLQPLITAMNIVASCMAGCATYAMAFKLSHHRSAALLSAIVFLTIPIVLFQTFSGYVDLFGAAFIVVGIGIFLYRLEPPPKNNQNRWYAISVFLSGCAWGVAIGTKQIYFVYAFACFSIAALTIIHETKLRYSKCIKLLLVMSIGVFMPSYFWFLRAFEATGNPFYPLSINFSHWIIPAVVRPTWMAPSGYADEIFVRSTLEWFIYPWIEYKKGNGFIYTDDSGLGAAFASIIVVGAFFSGFLAFKNRHEKTSRLHFTVLVTLIFMLLIWWFVLDRVPRFAIPAFAVACALSAPVLSTLIRANSELFKVLVVSSIVVTCFMLVSLPAFQLLNRLNCGLWQRSCEYRYPSLIDKLPEGSVVWNQGHELNNFPLAGKNLSNKLIPKYWGAYRSAQELIENEKVDYIVSSGGIPCDDCNLFAHLIYEDQNPESDKIYHNWRIWKVDKDRLKQ